MEENSFDIEKIMNIVNIAKALTSVPKAESKPIEEESKPIINESKAPLNTIKAAIPYMDEGFQKNIGIMVKLIEIENLINNFQAMSLGEGGRDRQIKMLRAVRPEIDQRKQKILDIFVRVIEIKDIMEGLAYEEH